MHDLTTLSAGLTRVVRTVPGVNDVFPTAPVILQLAAAGLDALPDSPVHNTVKAVLPTEETAVGVGTDGGGLAITVSIGVDEAGSATEVCRTVYSSIIDYLGETGAGTATSIAVTVGRIG